MRKEHLPAAINIVATSSVLLYSAAKAIVGWEQILTGLISYDWAMIINGFTNYGGGAGFIIGTQAMLDVAAPLETKKIEEKNLPNLES